jgi:hypothetical protein
MLQPHLRQYSNIFKELMQISGKLKTYSPKIFKFKDLKSMKKLIIIAIVFLVLCVGSIFGLTLVKNNFIDSAVNTALKAGSEKYNLPKAGELKDCKFSGQIITIYVDKKGAILECGSSNGKIQILATLARDGSFLFIPKWKFEGLSIYDPTKSY